MRTYLLSVVFSLFSIPLHAAPSMGLARATPMTAIVGTPTQITVTAFISDPSLIPTSVNLLQVNSDGTTTILGTLHDDGLNGDAFAGDSVFTFVTTMNASTVSQIRLQVSAAFKGVLQRVKSPTFSVFIQDANAPFRVLADVAQNLAAGNTAAALNHFVPSNKATSLTTLNQQGLDALTSIFSSAVLVSSQDDLRVFESPFATPNGTTTVEFTMIPSETGDWLINSW
jgi:hypothetical protein